MWDKRLLGFWASNEWVLVRNKLCEWFTEKYGNINQGIDFHQYERRNWIIILAMRLLFRVCVIVGLAYCLYCLTAVLLIGTCMVVYRACRGPPRSSSSALNSRVEGRGFDTALGQASQNFHLISPSCFRPNSAFIVQRSGLKHRHFISFILRL